jgi:uncharacterized membrane protein
MSLRTRQIISGIILLVILGAVILTVGFSPAVMVCMGVAVALYISAIAKSERERA